MKKKRIYILFGVVLCLFCFFKAKKIFSQNSSDIMPFVPNSNAQQSNEHELIKQWAEHYKKSHGINELYAYKAAVLNSSYACEVVANQQVCIDEMEELLTLNKIVIGRCSILSDSDQRLCMSLKKQDCSELNSEESALCQGFLNADPAIIERSSRFKEDDKEDAIRALAYYSAFKNSSVTSCTQFLGDDLYLYRLGCRVLLSPEPQRIIDSVALDFARYHYANIKKNRDLCDNIDDLYIGRYCKQGVGLSEFIDRYFLGD